MNHILQIADPTKKVLKGFSPFKDCKFYSSMSKCKPEKILNKMVTAMKNSIKTEILRTFLLEKNSSLHFYFLTLMVSPYFL